MDFIINTLHTLGAFFIVLSVIVFVHEFGHYIIAKWCGVKIETFSIGFGKEIFGFNDRSGTRWKLSLLPLGGYVKMYGDASAASTADSDELENMTDEQKALTFHHKSLPKKIAIVAAGPFANFILTICVFTYLIITTGLPSADPIIGKIMPNTPAQESGLQAGDRILSINNDPVKSFRDIVFKIMTNVGTPVTIVLERKEENLHVTLTPREVEEDDGLGNKVKRPLIGIQSAEINYNDVGPWVALKESVSQTYYICENTLIVIGQIVTGQRGTKDLRGPIGIAQISGQAAKKDAQSVLWLIALLSANLGLFNLLPIPLLDGGHIAYYAAEALRGKPLAERVQEYGFKIGFAFIAMLMVLTVFNDLRRLFS